MMGVWPLNESVAIGRARDKLRCLQLLSREGIGLPVTGFANSARQAEEMIKMVNGPPVVIKLLEGTQGIGVILSNTMSSAKSVFEAFRGAKINFPPLEIPSQGQVENHARRGLDELFAQAKKDVVRNPARVNSAGLDSRRPLNRATDDIGTQAG